MKRLFALVISLLGITGLNAQEFSEYFQNKTLRIDYIFAGNSSNQFVALDELSQSDGWAGRRVNMAETPVRGNGDIKVIDPASGKILYCNSFSSLFQEWLTTDEAQKLTKSFEATFLVPFPKQNIIVETTLLDNEGKVQAKLSHEVNPQDKLIRQLPSEAATPHKYLLKNGTAEEKIDIAIIAEGYTAAEMDIFLKDAQTACDEIFRYEPFATMKERFNVVAVMSPSEQSNVSVPQDGVWKKSAVNSNFMTFYSPRYLTTNSVHMIHDCLTGIAYEHLIILANTDTYGGGGIYNSYTLTTAHNPLFKPVVVHEFGHSFGALADEYFYDEPDHTENFYKLDYEPWEQNISSLVDFNSKWADMLDKRTKIPTEPTEKRKKNYTVGVYEGGGYMTKGMYRPAVVCRMRDNVATQFCPVCQRAIERIIRYNTEQK
ncbi:MAG: peptidase M64 [Alistipes sp.]|nr:peptidase M64 [Rikenellaceae bacterium]MBQ4127336.1 peptidase M64 [Alistipes sp.]